MRRLWFILSLCLLLLLTALPAFAAPATPPGATTPAKPDNTKPQIITDEKTNTVRILIGGREVVTIDAAGLHVNADVDYSGLLTATGGESRQASPRREADNTKPQIITDEKTSTVRVLIGGREVVTIDAAGLHVNGNFDHSGALTDTGGKP